MAICYLQSGQADEAISFSAAPLDDDGGGGWIVFQRAVVGLALAASLAASTFAAQLNQRVQRDPEEVPAGSLKPTPNDDDYYWINPVAPIPPSEYQQLPYKFGQDTEDVPAGNLKPCPDDEDYYWINRVGPVPATDWQPLPLNFGDDTEDVPAGSLKPCPDDEDFYWQNRVLPVPPSIYQPLPILFDAGETVPSVVFQPDEDYWSNPVAPTAPTVYQGLPYLPDLGDDPAGSLYGAYEDDSWRQFVSPVAPTIFQPLPIAVGETAEVLPAITFQSDEDFWQNLAAPIPAAFYQPLPYCPDPQDESAQFAWIELDWDADPTATSTVGYNIYRGTAGPGSEGSTPINSSPVDVGAAPNSLCTYLDSNIQWGVTYWYVVYSYDTSTDTQSSTPTGELSASYPPVLPDDDYWQNPVPPVGPTVYRLLPYLPDPTDDPAGSLHGQPDEDYWQNSVAPTPPTFWQQLPYACGDISDSYFLPLAPDEDFWANPVRPQPPTNYLVFPYASGEQSETVPALAVSTTVSRAGRMFRQFSRISRLEKM